MEQKLPLVDCMIFLEEISDVLFSLSLQRCVHFCRPCWTYSSELRTTSETRLTWPSSPRLCLSWWSTSTAQLSLTPESGGTWGWANVWHRLKVHKWQLVFMKMFIKLEHWFPQYNFPLRCIGTLWNCVDGQCCNGALITCRTARWSCGAWGAESFSTCSCLIQRGGPFSGWLGEILEEHGRGPGPTTHWHVLKTGAQYFPTGRLIPTNSKYRWCCTAVHLIQSWWYSLSSFKM